MEKADSLIALYLTMFVSNGGWTVHWGPFITLCEALERTYHVMWEITQRCESKVAHHKKRCKQIVNVYTMYFWGKLNGLLDYRHSEFWLNFVLRELKINPGSRFGFIAESMCSRLCCLLFYVCIEPLSYSCIICKTILNVFLLYTIEQF